MPSPAGLSAPSPGPVVNPLDDSARETFATGQPLEDNPDLQSCKHCKKSILKTAAKHHIAGCLRIKKEKAQRKKEAREARERARELAREEEARKNEDDVETRADDDSDDDNDGEKKVNGGKTTKKAAGKKAETADKKGTKRKADGEPDKAPKPKKKKDEPKPKVPKPKGELSILFLFPNSKPWLLTALTQALLMWSGNAVFCYRTDSLALDPLLANPIVWARNVPSPGDRCRTTCFLRPIRRRIRQNSRVGSFPLPH